MFTFHINIVRCTITVTTRGFRRKPIQDFPHAIAAAVGVITNLHLLSEALMKSLRSFLFSRLSALLSHRLSCLSALLSHRFSLRAALFSRRRAVLSEWLSSDDE